jgi:uncharacterized protein
MSKMKIALPITLVFIYTGLILLSSNLVKNIQLFRISQNQYLNFQANYQLLLVAITALSLVTTYFINRAGFVGYFSIGNILAQALEMKSFGIKANDNWIKTGLSLTAVISLVTGIFMYFQLKQATVNWSLLQNSIFWILLFSLTNSFGEEMIYRLGIVSPLKGLLSPMTICTISAVLFGIPHFAGMPNGIIGATMAGALGFVLAKSLLETNGLFWAWFIHFIQDVIIIGSLFLFSSKSV